MKKSAAAEREEQNNFMSGGEIRIGLEVHCELLTRSKLLCSCKNAFGQQPGANCCPVCAGYPGVLPVLNKRAVELAVIAGLALGCKPARYCAWERKNYFYPDLPKGWQTTQRTLPVAGEGTLEFYSGGQRKQARILRIQLEEDAGKLIHRGGVTEADFNRCGVPLIEIVTAPDFCSPEDAAAALEEIRTVLKYAGVSDVKMQEGSLRCDVNLSVRKSDGTWGERTEAKNLGSVKAVARCCAYEAERQLKLAARGEETGRLTLRWDDEKGTAYYMRDKENASDYRYIAEPDIPPVTISEDTVERLKRSMPPSKRDVEEKLASEYGLPRYDAEVLSADKALADLFEGAVACGMPPKTASNYVMNDVMQLAKKRGSEEYDIKITASALCDIWKLSESGEISASAARRILLPAMWGNARSAADTAREMGIGKLSEVETERVAREVVALYGEAVALYKDGDGKVFGYLMGQAMRVSGGRCDPALTEKILKKLLAND